MGLEKYALDAHKSFVKEHLVKVSFLLLFHSFSLLMTSETTHVSFFLDGSA